ncbi:MAG TPA: sulfite exporter TauE/SafE family protein, partial [archaeon]|nr:sulfite exporter TauE/SafE family protein [archaeon]
MGTDILALSTAAVTIGVTHTVLGPDHYLPFVVLARSRGWSVSRTSLITFFCGLGHVFSSVIIGIIGIAAGVMVSKLESVESVRGDIAAYLLLIFGTLYALWGLWRFFYPRKHKHVHLHGNGTVHKHAHPHSSPHAGAELNHTNLHTHESAGPAVKGDSTPWVLFLIFVFGPCEPLIPLLMYPAARSDFAGSVLVAVVFSIATVGTMLAVVLTLYAGARKARLGWL